MRQIAHRFPPNFSAGVDGCMKDASGDGDLADAIAKMPQPK